ncbi:MAG: zinc-ribbon domain-containing protein, partial [Candidatus Bathyarchaeia archaeon]
RDRLFFLRTGVAAGEVLRMQTVQKAAESLSQSPGAAVGAGIAVIPPLFQQAQTQPMIQCSRCGFQNPQTARFCMNCGSSMQPGQVCPKCGTTNPVGAKFCINCGGPLQQSTGKCPKCGSEYPPGARYCLNCGEKLA